MRPKNEVKKISSATRSDVHTGAGSLDEYIFSRKSGTEKIRDHNVDFPGIRPITVILQIYA